MTWHPTANFIAIKARAEMLERVRLFFAHRKVLEVETPLLGLASITDPHRKPIMADNGFLQTSFDFYMQRLLAAGSGDIYQVSKAFRKVLPTEHDIVEFTLLQWFRLNVDQWDIMDDLADLLEHLLGLHHFEYHSYSAVFEQYLGIDPLLAEMEQLKFEAQQHLNIEMPRGDKDDWLDLLMSYFIEPLLGQQTPVFIYDYPPSQAKMATLAENEQGACVAERFRLYYKGIVLASGHKVLTDHEEMQQRFQLDNHLRTRKGLKPVELDGDVLQALAHGLPACGSLSLGIDRLLMLQLKAGHIQDVISFIRPV